MQETAGELELAHIRVLGIPEHGESKVSHLGAIAKSIKRKIATWEFLIHVNDMVTCLKSKFWDNLCPSYCIRQIGEYGLVEKRKLNKLKFFNNIDGSSKFQVVIFKPH